MLMENKYIESLELWGNDINNLGFRSIVDAAKAAFSKCKIGTYLIRYKTQSYRRTT